MAKSKFGNVTYQSDSETAARSAMLGLLKTCPIPDDELLGNLGLFLNSKHLSRILLMDQLYSRIVDMPGVVVEFGTRWGQNLSLFAALRGIYEPFNRHRKIVGFDTFKGFPSVHAKDGASTLMTKGNLSVSDNYASYLGKILDAQEKDNPLGHIKKHELVEGDATVRFQKYLKDHPETIVALAYFDLDIYEPTKKCLELIKPRLVKGSVLGFDELNDPDSPGETVALMEAMGLNNIGLKRYRYASRASYFIME